MSQPTGPQIDHCVSKIRELIAEANDERRHVLQLGYNLGRLSELTGEGRAVWDDWKAAVEDWSLPELRRLASELTPHQATI